MSGIEEQRKQRSCVFGCDALVVECTILHRFPNPEKKPELFAAWTSAVDDNLEESYRRRWKDKTVCDLHFKPEDKTTGGRLICSAVPTINLTRIERSIVTFIEMDHSYCDRKKRRAYIAAPTPAVEFLAQTEPSGSKSTSCPVIEIIQQRSCQTKLSADETFQQLHGQSNSNTKNARKLKNEIRRLRQKAIALKKRLRLQQQTSKRELEKLCEKMSEPAKLFTRMQFSEGLKKKKGRRFTLEEKILSLSLYKKSPKAYKLMLKHFTLPSRKTLKNLLATIKISPGINKIIFEEISETVKKMPPQDRVCVVSFDEMSLTPQLQYNCNTDELVGFENYGNNKKTSKLADHVLVFMVKGAKSNYKQPVAYYFTQSLKSYHLKEIIKEVVANVQATGLEVIATVCDQGASNVSAINSLIAEAKEKIIREGKEWRKDVIIIKNKEIIPLFDVPHLLKGIRNNMLNKELKYVYDNEAKTVRWEYFQWVFEADKSNGELQILHKVTKEHIEPSKIRKMRVKNAAQVFSHSMAVAIDNLAARNKIPTECRALIPFVLLLDKLFDSLNASSFGIQNGKIYRAAVKRNSPHHQLWQDALKLLNTCKYIVKKDGGQKIEKSVPSINNLIRTIEGFKSLWVILSKKYNIDAMFTRNFNQDPLENFFGSIRSMGSRNTAPNCMAFEGAFKTLLLNNFSTSHSINSNCEEDNNDCLQSLKFFITQKVVLQSSDSSQSHIVLDQPLNIMNTNEDIDADSDQRVYVCGWAMSKCLQKVVKGCTKCKQNLTADKSDELYRYVRAKEYNKRKSWLCYPSKNLIKTFKDLQDITIPFLKSDCHIPNLKERIKNFAGMFVDFSFIKCKTHEDLFRNNFTNVTINIIIYSWCRSVNRILAGKIAYDGDDKIKIAALEYFKKHKTK